MPPVSTVGLAYTSYVVRMLQGQDIMQTTAAALPASTLIDLCVQAGAGGCQIDLSQIDPGDREGLARLRAMLEAHGLFVELSVQSGAFASAAAFASMASAAHALGATRVRAALLMGRRYESFETTAAWQAFYDEWAARLAGIAALAHGAGLVIGIENHKDWLAAELAALIAAVNHPALGVCVDFGNNLALLEDPAAVVETLAPVAVMTHLKDIAVRVTDEGFEMAEVPLGEGFLPLPQMVATLRRARPDLPFVLEMITRDPLPVAWRRDRYWTTRAVAARAAGERFAADLARHDRGSPLPRTTGLTPEATVQLEDDNVRACLAYARASLGL